MAKFKIGDRVVFDQTEHRTPGSVLEVLPPNPASVVPDRMRYIVEWDDIGFPEGANPYSEAELVLADES